MSWDGEPLVRQVVSIPPTGVLSPSTTYVRGLGLSVNGFRVTVVGTREVVVSTVRGYILGVLGFLTGRVPDDDDHWYGRNCPFGGTRTRTGVPEFLTGGTTRVWVVSVLFRRCLLVSDPTTP